MSRDDAGCGDDDVASDTEAERAARERRSIAGGRDDRDPDGGGDDDDAYAMLRGVSLDDATEVGVGGTMSALNVFRDTSRRVGGRSARRAARAAGRAPCDLVMEHHPTAPTRYFYVPCGTFTREAESLLQRACDGDAESLRAYVCARAEIEPGLAAHEAKRVGAGRRFRKPERVYPVFFAPPTWALHRDGSA